MGMEEREEREYSFVRLVYYNCNVLFRRSMFGALILKCSYVYVCLA